MFRFRIISSRYVDNYQIKAFKKDIKLASHIAKFRSFNPVKVRNYGVSKFSRNLKAKVVVVVTWLIWSKYLLISFFS